MKKRPQIYAKRLAIDLRSIINEPLPTISARPLDSDILEWHCNINVQTGPYSNAIFHSILTFPTDYPDSAPKIRLCTPVPHPSVFDKVYICLPIFTDPPLEKGKKDDLSNKWSSGYTVQSILYQLQCFFSAEAWELMKAEGSNISEDVKNKLLKKSITETHNFCCKGCGHSKSSPWPSINSVTSVVRNTGFHKLQKTSTKLLLKVLSFSSYNDLLSLRSTSKNIRDLIYSLHLVESRIHQCFHRKIDINSTILGYLLETGNYKQHKNDLTLAVHSPDVFSLEAFYEDGVSIETTTAAQTAKIMKFFLPLYISNRHASNIWNELELTMAELDNYDKFHPNMVITYISKLLYSTVRTLFMKAEQRYNGFLKKTQEQPFLEFHHFEKALNIYSQLHHIFLGCAYRYPYIEKHAFFLLTQFNDSPNARHKDKVSELGEYLILLLLTGSRLGWRHLQNAFLTEFYDRNVLHILRKFRELGDPVKSSICYRLTKTFECTESDLKLFLLQLAFLTISTANNEPQDVFQYYNQTYGSPNPISFSRLVKGTKRVLSLDSWPKIYDALLIKRPTPKELDGLLKQSLVNSRIRKYHPISLSGSYSDDLPSCLCTQKDSCFYANNKYDIRIPPPKIPNVPTLPKNSGITSYKMILSNLKFPLEPKPCHQFVRKEPTVASRFAVTETHYPPPERTTSATWRNPTVKNITPSLPPKAKTTVENTSTPDVLTADRPRDPNNPWGPPRPQVIKKVSPVEKPDVVSKNVTSDKISGDVPAKGILVITGSKKNTQVLEHTNSDDEESNNKEFEEPGKPLQHPTPKLAPQQAYNNVTGAVWGGSSASKLYGSNSVNMINSNIESGNIKNSPSKKPKEGVWDGLTASKLFLGDSSNPNQSVPPLVASPLHFLPPENDESEDDDTIEEQTTEPKPSEPEIPKQSESEIPNREPPNRYRDVRDRPRMNERDVRDVRNRDVRDVRNRDVRDVRNRDVHDVRNRDVHDVRNRDVRDRDVHDVRDRDVHDVRDRGWDRHPSNRSGFLKGGRKSDYNRWRKENETAKKSERDDNWRDSERALPAAVINSMNKDKEKESIPTDTIDDNKPKEKEEKECHDNEPIKDVRDNRDRFPQSSNRGFGRAPARYPNYRTGQRSYKARDIKEKLVKKNEPDEDGWVQVNNRS